MDVTVFVIQSINHWCDCLVIASLGLYYALLYLRDYNNISRVIKFDFEHICIFCLFVILDYFHTIIHLCFSIFPVMKILVWCCDV